MNYLDGSFLSQPLFAIGLPLLIIALVWTIAIKGVALWKSARNNHKNWFIALLLINTVGILELIYIFWISKKKQDVSEEDNEVEVVNK